jgi:hypothetical protein
MIPKLRDFTEERAAQTKFDFFVFCFGPLRDNRRYYFTFRE